MVEAQHLLGDFHFWAETWLKVSTPRLKESSIVKYRNLLHSYIYPQISNRDISEIKYNDISEMCTLLLCKGGKNRQGLSPKTVSSVLSVTKSIIQYASRNNDISLVSLDCLSVKQPQKPMRILSQEEQNRLIEYLLNNINTVNLGILLSMHTGIRIGELCALTWEDISFQNRMLHIHKTLQRIQTDYSEGAKTKIVITEPKSDCSIRNIPLSNEILKILYLNKKNDDAFILTGKKHYYVEPRNLQNHFKKILHSCDIQNVHFHTLRHSFATRCVENGFDIKSLSEILGHSSVNITLNRYVHPSMELKRKNMNMISAVLFS